MRDFSRDHRALSINTATVRKQASLDRIIESCAERGIRMICPWRDQVLAIGLDRTAKRLKDAGIALSGYCRGGFFPAVDAAGREAALAENRRAIEEAKTLGSPCLVLVVGSLPGALSGTPQSKDIALARAQVFDGIAATLEHARAVGMPRSLTRSRVGTSQSHTW